MQFDTERYPVADYKFRVHGALGAQAREFEVAQLTQLMQTIPQGSPAYWIILKGIISNYNIEEKEQLSQMADQFLQQALQPPEPQPDFDQQVKIAAQQLKEQEFQFKAEQSEVDNIRKDAEVEAEAERDRGEAIWNQSEAVLNLAKAQGESERSTAEVVFKQAKAAEALAGQPATQTSSGTQPLEYLALVDALKESFKDVTNSAVNNLNTSVNNSLAAISQKQSMLDMNPITTKLDALLEQQNQPPPAINLERDNNGMVTNIGGRPVVRGPDGSLMGVE